MEAKKVGNNAPEVDSRVAGSQEKPKRVELVRKKGDEKQRKSVEFNEWFRKVELAPLLRSLHNEKKVELTRTLPRVRSNNCRKIYWVETLVWTTEKEEFKSFLILKYIKKSYELSDKFMLHCSNTPAT